MRRDRLRWIIFPAFWFLCCMAVLAADPEIPPATISPDELQLVKQAEQARVAAIARAYPTVVAIYGNDRQGGGSGVLYDEAGFALTNHHVVAAAGSEGWAGLADGKLYRWKLIGTDPGGDVAIIRLSGQEKFPVAPLANSDLVRVGDFAMAMGNPFVLAEDQRPTVTLGIVSGIKRFQPGEGMNQLVYGNCIQVDSSINPGNSGGPLFSMQAEVLGINGRGSFEERGRVNVGLGYAISANQLKNFVPELLATKIAQHGTLDCIFGTRGGKVVCTSINFDAPIAREGLELGDELLEFEGETILDSNQFTNILSTLPAGWPVCVKFRRGEERITAYVRLSSLPYEPIVRDPQPEEKPADEESPAEKPAEKESSPEPMNEQDKGKAVPAEEEKKSDDQGDGDQEGSPAAEKQEDKSAEEPGEDAPQPKKIVVPQKKISLANAGKILDRDVNQTHAQLQFQRLRNQYGPRAVSSAADELPVLQIEDVIERAQNVVGRQKFLIAADGRFRAEYELDGERTIAIWDGTKFLLQSADGAKEVPRAKVLRDPYLSQAFVFRLLFAQDMPAKDLWILEGSDKAAGVAATRLAGTADDSESLYIWLRAFNDHGHPACDLLKSGVGLDDDEPIASVLYQDWKALADSPLQLPHNRQLVRGLAEMPQLQIRLQNATILSQVDAAWFQLNEK